MQAQHTNIEPMSTAQLAALMAILEEFRNHPMTPAVMALAARLARLEVA